MDEDTLGPKAALVTQLYRDLWEMRDLEVIRESFTEQTYMDGPMTRLVKGGTSPFETVATLLSVIQGDIRVEYEKVEEAGDWVLCFIQLHFINHPYKPDFTVPAVLNSKVKGKVVTDVHFCMNYIELFEGLGQMPEDTLTICLTGAELTWKD